jgi:putative redox protein
MAYIYIMGTKISIKNLPDGYQSLVGNGKHTIVADHLVESGGTDLGMSPGDLLMSSLAHCKVLTIRHLARKKNWPVDEITAQLEYEVARGEGRHLATKVYVSIQITGNITEDQRAELLKRADDCQVQRMLKGEWEFLAGSLE